MTTRRRGWIWRFGFPTLLGMLCLFVGRGCSKPNVVTISIPKEQIECPKPLPPATADEAVLQVLAGLQRQKLDELWEFLPQSYQRDVDWLVHDFGKRLDKRCWEPFVATCRKARDVASQIGRNAAASGYEVTDSEKEWAANARAVEQFLGALGDSRLTDVRELQSLDARRSLLNTGNKMMAALSQGTLGDTGLGGDPFSQIREVKVELLESTEDSAVLILQWPGQEPTQHNFVRVEQRWIPQTLAEAWPTEFPKVREQVLAWADELCANPEPWHARLREIDQLLDELAKTKTLAETRQVWQTGVTHLAVEWFGATQVASPKVEENPIESPPPVKPVRVKKPDTEVLLPDEPQK